MAGAGSKLFIAQSKLTAAQVNTYLMDQTIMRFATTTARDNAFGGAGEASLAEGMTCYIDADNTIYTYDGAAWVKMVSASTPPGLELITAYSVGSTPVSSVTVPNVFSATYDSYKIIYDGGTASASHEMYLQLSGLTTGYYGFTVYGVYTAATVSGINYNNVGGFLVGGGDANYVNASCELDNPFLAKQTICRSQSANSADRFAQFSGRQVSNTSVTGFALQCTVGTIVNGFVRVYGYRNS